MKNKPFLITALCFASMVCKSQITLSPNTPTGSYAVKRFDNSGYRISSIQIAKYIGIEYALPKNDTIDWKGFVKSTTTIDYFNYTAKHFSCPSIAKECVEIEVYNPITKKSKQYTFNDFRDLVWPRLSGTN